MSRPEPPLVVVKYGGAALDGSLLTGAAVQDLKALHRAGRRVLLVHGGGRAVSEEAARRGLVPRFVGGLRVTDREMMDVVRMVLVGRINKDLVGQLDRAGVRAIGLSGEDGRLLTARPLRAQGEALGYVGEVAAVRTDVLAMVWNAGLVPVVASVAADAEGVPHNLNADVAAAELAASLRADRLVYVSDVDGLMRDPADPASVISRLGAADLNDLLRSRPPEGGMLPKLTAALFALRSGVRQVHLVSGRRRGALLAAVLAEAAVGTLLHN